MSFVIKGRNRIPNIKTIKNVAIPKNAEPFLFLFFNFIL